MKTIQQQLANKLYELLPHKKELEFGCEFRFNNEGENLEQADILITDIVIDKSEGQDHYTAEPYLYITGAKNTYDFPDRESIEIIGQKLGLADLLMAIDIKLDHQQEPEIYEYICSEFDREGRDKKVFYNLSKDNILDQSDEFCKFALELLTTPPMAK